ncbi:nucleotidyltransferase domain-containing protein [Mesobacillus foraminis]|uniref:nucleotidyltransferase domain-containing protein n=1 Tax=Mesobacillus foraminis TaxID=279826 RepID=UPI000EF4A64A|nr:nucleotidyltransferase family protein [Mesobacillus foraminis]
MESKLNLDLTGLPKELNLILSIIGKENNRELKGNDSDIDWDLFIELALHHRLFPALYMELTKSNNHVVPTKVVEVLGHVYKANTFEMMRLCAEMDFVNRLCIDNQIPVLFLKGPVLAADLYGDLSLRTSCDLDIIVPIKELDKMESLLILQGYEKDEYILSILGDWKWRHHHITFFHPDKKIKVEVHWRLNPGPGFEPSFHELWRRKRKSSLLNNNPLYFLGKEDLFFFLVTHGSRHGWSRLRWLTDIHQILKQEIDWPFLYKILKKNQSLQIAGQAIILSSVLLNTIATDEMNRLTIGKRPKRLAQQAIFYLERMINLHSEPLPIDVTKYHKDHLFELMTKKQKFLFTLSFVYPYHTDLETMPLPKYLHFMYFPLRPFLSLWRKTRNHALQ